MANAMRHPYLSFFAFRGRDRGSHGPAAGVPAGRGGHRVVRALDGAYAGAAGVLRGLLPDLLAAQGGAAGLRG